MPITDPVVGSSTKVSWAVAVDAQLNSSNISLVDDENNGVPNLINGSFETYASVLGVNVPINWQQTLLTGGAFLVDTSVFTHGIASVKFTAPGGGGNGGGYIQSTDLLPVSPNQVYAAQFFAKSDVSGMINKAELFWFNASQNPCSTPSTTIWSSSSISNTWTLYQGFATPPSDGCFVQIRLTGGNTGSPSGNTWFDGVQYMNLNVRFLDLTTSLNLSAYQRLYNTIVATGTGPYTLDLGPVISSPREIKIYNGSSNPLSVVRIVAAGDKINGTTSALTIGAGAFATLINDGVSNWYQVG